MRNTFVTFRSRIAKSLLVTAGDPIDGEAEARILSKLSEDIGKASAGLLEKLIAEDRYHDRY